MKRLLICTDGSAAATTSYYCGLWAAKKLQAIIDIIFVTDVRGQTVATRQNFSGSLELESTQTLLEQIAEVESDRAQVNYQIAKKVLDEASLFFEQADYSPVNLIHETGQLVECVQEYEHEVELVILGRQGQSEDFPADHVGANVERLLHGSHHPCLVTAGTFNDIQKLLLAYDGSPSCQKMLQYLLSSPLFQGLELHLLSVAKSEELQQGYLSLEEAQKQAETAGFHPICQQESGTHPEQIIATYEKENDIDLLLMGAYGHSRVHRMMLGSATHNILKKSQSQTPVMLFR